MIDKFILFIVFGLAIYRIVHMLQVDNGPFGIFGNLQQAIGKLKDRNGGLKEMYFCFNCLSVWISIPFALILNNKIEDVLISIFALSTIAIMINRYVE